MWEISINCFIMDVQYEKRVFILKYAKDNI